MTYACQPLNASDPNSICVELNSQYLMKYTDLSFSGVSYTVSPYCWKQLQPGVFKCDKLDSTQNNFGIDAVTFKCLGVGE